MVSYFQMPYFIEIQLLVSSILITIKRTYIACLCCLSCHTVLHDRSALNSLQYCPLNPLLCELRVHYFTVCISPLIYHQTYVCIQMLIGQVIPLIAASPQVFAFCQVILLPFSVIRNNLLLLTPMLKLSNVHLLFLPPLLSYSNYIGSYTT